MRMKEDFIEGKEAEGDAMQITVSDIPSPNAETVQPPTKEATPQGVTHSQPRNQTPAPSTSLASAESSSLRLKRKAILIEPKKLPMKKRKR